MSTELPGAIGRRLSSPLGELFAAAGADGVCALEFADDGARFDRQRRRLEARTGPITEGRHPFLDRLEAELREYFAGERRRFDVPLAPHGTMFQQLVWDALLTIPYGATRAYSDVAERIGRRGAQRAVGLANGRNPIAILIPCHRVIERSGGLRGYGGGLWRKKFLLDLERRVSRPDDLASTPLGRAAARDTAAPVATAAR
jgi:O-6-methylguanine DNA methyltransferase